MANKENVKRMSRGKHQRDFSGPVTGTTDICMRLAFYIILRRVRVRDGGGRGEAGGYRSYTHTHTHIVYEIVSVSRRRSGGGGAGWSSFRDKLAWRQKPTGA